MKPNEILSAILREMSKDVEVIPAGWKTIDQWAKEWGYSRSRARDYVLKGCKLGIMQGRFFRYLHPKKGPFKVKHFAPTTCRNPKGKV
jgi:hypothetical protein